MEYIFNYKEYRAWFWKKKKVVGHKYDKSMDKMVLYFSDGLETISCWKKYDMKLGSDWALVEKNTMENESNTSVNLVKK